MKKSQRRGREKVRKTGNYAYFRISVRDIPMLAEPQAIQRSPVQIPKVAKR